MKRWDTWAYQEQLLRKIDRANVYRREHIARLNRGQGNGSAYMRDSIAGEVEALSALLGGAAHRTPRDVAAKIESLLREQAPALESPEHLDSFQNGWAGALRIELSAAREHFSVEDEGEE